MTAGDGEDRSQTLGVSEPAIRHDSFCFKPYNLHVPPITMKGVVTGGYVLAAAGCSLYLQLLKVKEKLGAGGAEGESSGSQAD